MKSVHSLPAVVFLSACVSNGQLVYGYAPTLPEDIAVFQRHAQTKEDVKLGLVEGRACGLASNETALVDEASREMLLVASRVGATKIGSFRTKNVGVTLNCFNTIVAQGISYRSRNPERYLERAGSDDTETD